MQVRIVYFQGCPNHEPAMALVQEIAEEIGVQVDVLEVGVESEEDAKRERMLGSPTIQVNGRDIDPSARSRSDFAMSCRVFGGSEGLPPREMILAALRGEVPETVDQTRPDGKGGCCS